VILPQVGVSVQTITRRSEYDSQSPNR